MTNRPYVNGIIAAFLSANIIPAGASVAKDTTPQARRPTVQVPATLPVRPGETSKPVASTKGTARTREE